MGKMKSAVTDVCKPWVTSQNIPINVMQSSKIRHLKNYNIIFDKISWNKIWKSFLCNAIILLILMHWNSPFCVCKAEAFRQGMIPFLHLFLNVGGPGHRELKFDASTPYLSALIFFQQFCQRL